MEFFLSVKDDQQLVWQNLCGSPVSLFSLLSNAVGPRSLLYFIACFMGVSVANR